MAARVRPTAAIKSCSPCQATSRVGTTPAVLRSRMRRVFRTAIVLVSATLAGVNCISGLVCRRTLGVAGIPLMAVSSRGVLSRRSAPTATATTITLV